MSFGRKTAVICEFNENELRGFELILDTAENGLDEGYMTKKDRWAAETMISELRKVFWPEESE